MENNKGGKYLKTQIEIKEAEYSQKVEKRFELISELEILVDDAKRGAGANWIVAKAKKLAETEEEAKRISEDLKAMYKIKKEMGVE